MSTILSITSTAATSAAKPQARPMDRGHRLRVSALITIFASIVVALAIYGFDYYRLGVQDRPFSSKHHLLRPSGRIGIDLGIFGVAIFLAIFLYPLRKRVRWLGKIGSSKHWLDFHIVFGLTAPVIIAFHSSFKFNGIAGMAFWIMFAVALSGIAGRYIYAQIPRSLNSAELSMRDLQAQESEFARAIAEQSVLEMKDLEPLLRVPSPEQAAEMPMLRAMLSVVALDIARPFRVARLRVRVLGIGGLLVSLGGLLRSSNSELECVVDATRQKSALSKRIVFLSRTQQVFHLWHVVHRPFSYSFAVLALIHIAVVTLFGFM